MLTMSKKWLGPIAMSLLALPLAAFAGKDGNGNGAPSGPHYNLNIIGVEKAKKADMTGSNRHTIFVPLKSTKTGNKSVQVNDDGSVEPGTAIVDSKIWLTPGDDFRVCDGNGFDLAYGCDDSFDETWNRWEFNDNDELVPMVDRKEGAVFELPCNTNLDADGAEEFIECDPANPVAHYQVWARALGKPGGEAMMTTCATVDFDTTDGDDGYLTCSLENTILTRDKGKSLFTDVTQELTSLLAYICDVDLTQDGSGNWICDDDGDLVADPEAVTLTRIALFAGDTEDWFWNYDNNGLRLAQLRFYEVE